MRKLILLLIPAVLLVCAATAVATAGGAPAHAAATRTVGVGDSYFTKKTLRVKKGTVVKWVWGASSDDGATVSEHNVRGIKGNRFLSKDKTDGTYSKRITRTTTVICTIHPTIMRMKITVVK